MNTSERDEHWKSLADQIGADVPEPAPSEQQQPPDEAGEPMDPASRRRRRATPAPRMPSDWNALASELGLEPPPPPVEEPAAEPPPPAAEIVEEEIEKSVQAVEERVTTEPSDLDEADMAEEPAADELEPGIAFFEPDSAVERDLADVEEAGNGDDLDEPLDELEAAVELEARARDEPEEPESSEAPAEDSVSSRRRRKRGRRGGARTGRSVDEEAGPGAETEPSETLEAADEQDEAEQERRPRRRRRRPRRTEAETETGEVEVTEAAEPQPAAEEGGRPKHRKIPTWEEAIGIIVENNLETRAKSNATRNNPRGQRRRGQGPGKRRP